MSRAFGLGLIGHTVAAQRRIHTGFPRDAVLAGEYMADAILDAGWATEEVEVTQGGQIPRQFPSR